MKPEILTRISELEQVHFCTISIKQFDEWVNMQIEKYDLDFEKISKIWLQAISETITLKRRSVAPIDEPTIIWINELKKLLK